MEIIGTKIGPITPKILGKNVDICIVNLRNTRKIYLEIEKYLTRNFTLSFLFA